MMTDNFELYESVKIKSTDIIGAIVAEDPDGGTKLSLYLIEKDEKINKVYRIMIVFSVQECDFFRFIDSLSIVLKNRHKYNFNKASGGKIL